MFVAFSCCKVSSAKESFTHTARNYVIVGGITNADLFFSRAWHEVGLSMNCMNSQFKFVA